MTFDPKPLQGGSLEVRKESLLTLARLEAPGGIGSLMSLDPVLQRLVLGKKNFGGMQAR